MKSANTIYDCTENAIGQGIEKLLTEDFNLQLTSLCLFGVHIFFLLIFIASEKCRECDCDCDCNCCERKRATIRFTGERFVPELNTY